MILQRGKGERGDGPSGKLEGEAAAVTADEEPIRCRRCAWAITYFRARTERAGAHIHNRTNPAGIEWEFGCFMDAPGCATLGDPTAEATWFAGYRWSLATCRSCASHLGWRFDGESPFFALVLAFLSMPAK